MDLRVVCSGVAMGLASRGHKSLGGGGGNSRGHFHSQLNGSILILLMYF